MIESAVAFTLFDKVLKGIGLIRERGGEGAQNRSTMHYLPFTLHFLRQNLMWRIVKMGRDEIVSENLKLRGYGILHLFH